MNQERILEEMTKLQEELGFTFNDINWLSKAMYSKKIKLKNVGKNNKTYKNESLATVGDSIIYSILLDRFYTNSNGKIIKMELHDIKEIYCVNEVFSKAIRFRDWIRFAFNDDYFIKDNPPQEDKVVTKDHDPYIEAIVGAMYFDSGYEKTKGWINEILFPILEECKEEK